MGDTRRVVRHALQRESKDLNARTHARTLGSFEGSLYRPMEGKEREMSAPLVGQTMMPAKSALMDDPPMNQMNFCCPSPLSMALSIIGCFSWLGACRVVNEKEGGLLLTWGKFTSVLTTPGIYCINPCGTSLKKITLKQQATELPNVKLLDLKGNPVVVSGVVFWQVHSIKAAVLNVESVYQYVQTSASAVLKQVVSKYPYEDDDNGGHSLKTEAAAVSQEMTNVLQDRLAHAGVRVIAFNLADLSYAPEIAQAMLVRQQAEAMVKARRLIVKGAVDISEGAITQLEAKGVPMEPEEKTKIVTNLLTVICGESGVQPTMGL